MKIKTLLLFLFISFCSVVFPQTGSGTGTTTTETIQSAGLTVGTTVAREYKMYIPSSYDGTTPYSLIFNFHGTGSNAQQQQWMSGFDKIADTANIIMIYPEGLEQPNSGSPPPTAWNCLGSVQENKDTDLKFVDDLLTYLLANYNINGCKVYATGMSIGGFMTHDVGCFLSEKFAAIASVTGLSTHLSSCDPQHPLPVMQIHGDNDEVVPYEGFGGAGVDDIISYWVSYNNCNISATATPVPDITTADNSTATNHLYTAGDNGSTVELYKIAGGEHKWPTLGSTTAGTNGDFSASIEIWKFFRQFCLDELNGTPPVCDPPTITAEPTDKTICAGDATTFQVIATGTNVTYQWQENNGGGVFTDITGEKGPSLTVSPTGTILYQCVVSGDCTPDVTSATVRATINTVATSVISGDATVCPGTTSTTIAVDLTGTPDWEITYAIDGTDQTLISNITASPYTFTVDVAAVYTISTTTDNTGCAGTNTGSATTTEDCGGGPCAASATISGDAEICPGSTTQITIDLTGPGPWTLVTAIDGVAQPSASPTTSPYTYNASAAEVHTVTSVSDNTACNGSKSGSATITETATLTISNLTEVCNGGNADYVVEFDVADGDASAYSSSGNTGSFTSPTHFTSDAITSGTAYTITIDDACTTPVDVTGNKDCSTPPPACTADIAGGGTVCPASSTTSDVTITATGTGPWMVVYAIDNIDQASQQIPVSPFTITVSDAGIYTLTSVTNAGGCVATVSGSATITEDCSTPPPICTATAAISGNATICPGTTTATVSIALVGSAPFGITYAIDGVDQTPVSANASPYTFTANVGGSYTITNIIDATNCVGTSSGSATILENCNTGPCTATATISGGGSICDGSSTTIQVDLTGTPPWGFTLDPGAVLVTNQQTSPYIFTSSVAGDFTINNFSDATCFGTTNGSALVESCHTIPGVDTTTVGIDESTLLDNISIYPNPTDGTVSISLNNSNYQNIEITIFDLLGRVVYSDIENNVGVDFTTEIDLSDKSNGIYYIKINDGTDVKITKLIVQ